MVTGGRDHARQHQTTMRDTQGENGRIITIARQQVLRSCQAKDPPVSDWAVGVPSTQGPVTHTTPIYKNGPIFGEKHALNQKQRAQRPKSYSAGGHEPGSRPRVRNKLRF